MTLASPPGPIMVTRVERVVVHLPPAPPARGHGLLVAYAQTRPALGAAVARARRPETVDHLNRLDRQVRVALRPFREHPRAIDQAEIDAAIDALGALRTALAIAPR